MECVTLILMCGKLMRVDWDRQKAEDRVRGNDRPNAEYILTHIANLPDGRAVHMIPSVSDPSMK